MKPKIPLRVLSAELLNSNMLVLLAAVFAISSLEPCRASNVADARKLYAQACAEEDGGKLEQAHATLRELLRIQNQLAVSELEKAKLLLDIARVSQMQRDQTEAELNYRQALTIYKNVCGHNSLMVATALNRIAAIVLAGQAKESSTIALQYFAQALDISEQSSSKRSYLARVESLEGSGEIQMALDDFRDAEHSFRRALKLRKQMFPSDKSAQAIILCQMARMCLMQNNLPEAETSSREARRLGLGTSWKAAILLNNLGVVYYKKGMYETAMTFFNNAMVINDSALTLGSEPINLLNHRRVSEALSLDNLALIYMNNGNLIQAEQMLLKSLSLQEYVFGPKDNSLRITLSSLISDYKRQDKNGQAAELEKKILHLESPKVSGYGPFLMRD